MTDRLDQIKHDRGKVYGDPLWNHLGISYGWAPLLAPCWRMIRDYVPIPPHVAAMMLTVLKCNRTRLVFHEDNYCDMANYAGFAGSWQKMFDEGSLPMQRIWDGMSLSESQDESASPLRALYDRGVSLHYDARERKWTYGKHDADGSFSDWSNGLEFDSLEDLAREVCA